MGHHVRVPDRHRRPRKERGRRSSSSSSAWTGGSHDPSPLEDLPIITPADALTGAAYGNNAYGKAALGYLALKDMLGDDLFRQALHGFMDRWHGKHPIPWDFFNTFNDVAGATSIGSGTRGSSPRAHRPRDRRGQEGGRGYTVDDRQHRRHAGTLRPGVTFADGTSRRSVRTSAIWEANRGTRRYCT